MSATTETTTNLYEQAIKTWLSRLLLRQGTRLHPNAILGVSFVGGVGSYWYSEETWGDGETGIEFRVRGARELGQDDTVSYQVKIDTTPAEMVEECLAILAQLENE